MIFQIYQKKILCVNFEAFCCARNNWTKCKLNWPFDLDTNLVVSNLVRGFKSAGTKRWCKWRTFKCYFSSLFYSMYHCFSSHIFCLFSVILDHIKVNICVLCNWNFKTIFVFALCRSGTVAMLCVQRCQYQCVEMCILHRKQMLPLFLSDSSAGTSLDILSISISWSSPLRFSSVKTKIQSSLLFLTL